MPLMRRLHPELEWPERFGRRLVDWPAMTELFRDELPKVEELRQDGTVVVRAEMPGIDPDRDVEITVVGGELRIHAERRQESKTEDTKGFRSEFQYGSFTRCLPLPAGATDTDVKATYTDGILEVRIPVSEQQAGEKKIAVARG